MNIFVIDLSRKSVLVCLFVCLFGTKVSHSELRHQGFIKFEQLERMVYEMNFPFPDIVIAQAKLETGHFKSEVFRMNNNLFGMRHPRQRVTLSKGSNLNHAVYDSWQHSLMTMLCGTTSTHPSTTQEMSSMPTCKGCTPPTQTTSKF